MKASVTKSTRSRVRPGRVGNYAGVFLAWVLRGCRYLPGRAAMREVPRE
jgi:hypothetical protein